ncbi:MAG: competence/damage-inducible protein A [Bacillota bacterium]|jgi:nicotinamide-nucleotide amidase
MRAELICIGTELLLGQTVDTNATFLSRELADLGIDLYHKTTVGDNLQRMGAVLGTAWDRAELLILSGGLGPTQDDLTREAVAGLLGETLEFQTTAWQEIEAFFAKLRRPVAVSNRRQAMFPPSGRLIPNPVGTAPGLLVEKEDHVIVALPGVPRELTTMWERSVRPFLQDRLAREEVMVLTSKFIRVVGIGESMMEEKVIDLIQNQTNPTIAPYAGQGEACLRLTAKSRSKSENLHLLDSLQATIAERLGPFIYGYDYDNLETVIGRLLQAKGWRLAVAESCTGGLAGHRITNVPGSSAYYLGGINSYSNRLKMKLLGVPETTLREHGAVSSETAQAMAEGVRRISGAEVGLASTGIAGPGGAAPGKPVGLIYLAVVAPGFIRVESRVFPYNRIGNKEAAAQMGLTLLWQGLTGK